MSVRTACTRSAVFEALGFLKSNNVDFWEDVRSDTAWRFNVSFKRNHCVTRILICTKRLQLPLYIPLLATGAIQVKKEEKQTNNVQKTLN